MTGIHTERAAPKRRLSGAGAVVAALAGLGLLPSAAPAQDAVGIVAVVNETVITDHDLEQRLRLALASAGLTDTLEVRERLTSQMLRTLIDEALQVQEASRLDVSATPGELEDATRVIEERNGIPAGGFSRFLAEQGVEESAVMAQLRAEISWGKVIQVTLVPQVEVSEEEVAEALARSAASEGKFRVLLSEIFLEVETPDRAAGVIAQLERLAVDIEAGAEFTAVARQFSQSASAYQSGDVGWVLEEQLAPEMAAAVSAMEPGSLSAPVASAEGYFLLWLRDRRVVGALDPRDTEVHLMQVALPLTADAPPPDVARALARAETIGATVQGCAAMVAMIDEVGTPQSGDLGILRIGDMPARFRDALANLAIGQLSAPVRSDEAVHVFVVCERREPELDLPDREDVEAALWDERLDMLSRRYLRDLRRNAIIDVR